MVAGSTIIHDHDVENYEDDDRKYFQAKPENNEESYGGRDNEKTSHHGCPKHLQSPLSGS